MFDSESNFFSQDYSQPPSVIINEICVSGNKTTKEKVILRELTFHKSDTVNKEILDELLKESRENLLNTLLFNYVSLDYFFINPGIVEVSVWVSERWYFWPNLIFDIADRNFNVWWLSKDFNRINYGLFFIKYNFRGNNEELRLKVQAGYNQELAIKYSIPFINKKQTFGLGFTAGYVRNHEIFYKVENNLQQFHKDEQGYSWQKIRSGLEFSYKKDVRIRHRGGVEYNIEQISDTIARLNSDFYLDSALLISYLSSFYKIELDQRNSKVYPLKGNYFSSELGYKIGTDLNMHYLYFTNELKNFIQLGRKFYYAQGFKLKLSSPWKTPFIFEKAMGYRDFVRGYEYYIINGQQFFLSKFSLRYLLLPTVTHEVKILPLIKFNTIHHTIYLNTFVDIGYVYDRHYSNNNSLSNSVLVGGGVSLNYVSYYDFILRLEYSINKFGEHGFFIHMVSPI